MSEPKRDDWAYYEQRIEVGDCWTWVGSISDEGYPRASRGWAHREVWALLVGPIPKGHEVDHLCKNRACVNPDHLEPVTRRENARRSVNAQAIKTHCKHGHEFTPENIYDGRGYRECRSCRRGWQIERRQRAKEMAHGS